MVDKVMANDPSREVKALLAQSELDLATAFGGIGTGGGQDLPTP